MFKTLGINFEKYQVQPSTSFPLINFYFNLLYQNLFESFKITKVLQERVLYHGNKKKLKNNDNDKSFLIKYYFFFACSCLILKRFLYINTIIIISKEYEK